MTDPLGYPVIRITAEYKQNERAVADYLQEKMARWYLEAGAIEIVRAGLGGQMGVATHAYGGTRMGDDAETNVLNRYGLSHEVPNLGSSGPRSWGRAERVTRP